MKFRLKDRDGAPTPADFDLAFRSEAAAQQQVSRLDPSRWLIIADFGGDE